MGETKLYYWSVQPIYLSFRDLVAKEKSIIHPSMEYLFVRMLGGNTRVVMGEIKPYYWSVQPMYLSFRDLVSKEKSIIHPSMEYFRVRR